MKTIEQMYKIAKNIVWQYIKKGLRFTYWELCTSIQKAGCIMRVSLGVTISDYLRFLEEKGIIKEDYMTEKKSNEFIVLKKSFV